MGDAGRTRRLIRLGAALSAPPLASLPVASGGWAETKAASRRREHAALDWREVLAVPTRRTGERRQGQPVVLGLQATTAVDVTRQPGIAGLGRLSYAAPHGQSLHPTLGATPAGLAVGVLDAWLWAREPKDQPHGKARPRWVEGYASGAALAASVPNTRRVYVADRAGELRALMAAAARRGHPADWLVRANHNRRPTAGDTRWDRLARSEPLGEVEFTLPAAPGRPVRLVRQPRYRDRLTLPARQGAPARTVTAILAREAPPPAGERAIEWRLVPPRAAEALEQVVQLIDWSRRRWLVEMVFRILQSGGRVAARHLRTLARRARALGIDLIRAGRILPRVPWGRDGPDLPGEVVFAPEEWQAAWIVAHRRPPPVAPPRLNDMVRLSAGFGGCLGRNRERHPGPKALWEGRQRVRAVALGIQAGRAIYACEG